MDWRFPFGGRQLFKPMRITAILFLVFVLAVGIAFAQKGQSSVVLLRGKAIEYRTNNPLQINFFLVSSAGKKIPVKSSNDGNFQIPISQSDLYRVVANDWICREPDIIDIKINDNYSEHDLNLLFEPFKENLELGSSLAFLPNQSELQPNGKSLLDEIIFYNKVNPKLFFKISIGTNDSYFKKITKTEKVGKKQRKIIITEQEQAQELASFRIQSIKQYLATKLPERNFEIIALPYTNVKVLSKTTKKKKKSTEQTILAQAGPNMTIVISKIMNMGTQSR